MSSKKFYGWRGKILLIDLSSKKFESIKTPENIYKDVLGGRGFCGYFMRESGSLTEEYPYSPMMIFPGPLTGVAPFASKTIVAAISPLTNTFFTSAFGGSFGEQLKKAGWDGIIITGQAQNLAGVDIKNEEVSFITCNELKGKTASEIFNKLNPLASAAINSIAADNGVKFANIISDRYFFAGRGGLGCAMAEKNLKFIQVYGSGDIPIYNPEELETAVEDIMRLAKASPSLMGELGFAEFGTASLYDLIGSREMMPAKNFKAKSTSYNHNLNAYNFKNKYQWQKIGCTNCPVLCKRITKAGVLLPEYNAMAHFSSLIENDDIDLIMEANKICNEAGMDTISAASSIACYMEIKNKTVQDTDILKLLNAIACGEDDGKMLKDGSLKFAQRYKAKDLAITVKGLDLPAFDPWGAYGFALAYATSTRGGCYLQAYPLSHEILRKPVATDRFTFEGKARINKLNEDMNATMDSLVMCRFSANAFGLEECGKILSAVTGETFSAGDLMKCGERIFYNEKIINSARGFDAKDDDLPELFFTSGNPINREDFLKARSNYYKIRGLSPEGRPLKEKAVELKLKWQN